MTTGMYVFEVCFQECDCLDRAVDKRVQEAQPGLSSRSFDWWFLDQE